MSSSRAVATARRIVSLVVLASACRDKEPPPALPEASDDGRARAAEVEASAPRAQADGAVLSPGCGRDGPRGYRDGVALDVDGRARTYAISVPEDYEADRAYPLVLSFHGDARTGASLRAALAVEEHGKGKAIFVYPDGLGGTWRNDDPPDRSADLRFFDALLSDVGGAYCVDRARVMVAGFSRGAYFANQLACRRPVRAIAPNAGGGPYRVASERGKGTFACPVPAPAVLVIHGADDRNVGKGEGRKSREHWRKANECGESRSPSAPSPCVAFEGCRAGRPVVFCEVDGLGHAVWPEAPAAIWRFFASF